MIKDYIIKDNISNISNCDFESDKSFHVGENLEYKSCECKKKLLDEFIEECGGNINRAEMIYNDTLNNYESVCNSCIIYIALLVTAFLITIGVSSAFIYFYCYLKKTNNIINNIMPTLKQ